MTVLAVLLPLAATLALARPSATSTVEPRSDDYRLTAAGADMSSTEAASLERRLLARPTLRDLRVKLIGYYDKRQFDSPEDYAKRYPHVLWFIVNAPTDPVFHLYTVTFFTHGSKPWCERATAAWSKQLDAHPGDLFILRHAAMHLRWYAEALAETALRRGRELEPREPYWPEQLGDLLLQRAMFARDDRVARAKSAAEAMTRFREAVALSATDTARGFLVRLAKSAYAAGELDQARAYAADLVRESEQAREHATEMHFVGHTILGLIAVKAGKEAEAERQLIASVSIPILKQDSYFGGPYLGLAQLVLYHGGTDVVVRFLDLCPGVWSTYADQFSRMKTDILAGDVPDFTSHLFFN